MNILIAGCGKIGTTLIGALVNEGHDVVAIDNDPAVIEEITNLYDIMAVCGLASDCETLTEAGVEKARLFIAVTASDELNMLSCFIARKMGASYTVARIRNPEYNDESLDFMRQQLGISMAINPEMLAAEEIYNLIKLPTAIKVESFSRHAFELIQLKLTDESIFIGQKLTDLRAKYKAKFLICVVQRGDDVFIPDGNFVLRSGDRIGVCAAQNELHRFFREIKSNKRRARDVMLLGGSTTSFYLAKKLLESGSSVKIIDKDPARCEEISELLPAVDVVLGDGNQQELMLEEGITEMDAFVALTGLDEVNILLSFYASNHNVPRTVAKVNRQSLSSIADRLGLDCIISPKDVTSNIIIRYARALQNTDGSDLETLYRLMDGKAEAIELNIGADSKIVGAPLCDIHFKDNTLIAGIIRGRKPFIPTGADEILPGDKIVVIVKDRVVNDLSDILA